MRSTVHIFATSSLIGILLLSACSPAPESTEVELDVEDLSSDEQSDVDEELDLILYDGACPTVADPNGDLDNDGLVNAAEDLDADCEVDPGETDFRNVDSDGDGLTDGDEDINGRDGADDGELSATAQDTDGDGIDDPEEDLALVCLRSTMALRPEFVPGQSAGSTLALPEGWRLLEAATGAAVFRSPDDQLLGWIVRFEELGAEEPIPLEIVDARLLNGLEATGTSVEVIDQISFDLPDFEIRHPLGSAVRTRAELSGATGDLGLLRAQTLESATGTTITSLPLGPSCSEVSTWFTSFGSPREDHVVSIGLMGCTNALAGPGGTWPLFQDFSNMTHVVFVGPAPARAYCQTGILEPGDKSGEQVLPLQIPPISGTVKVASGGELVPRSTTNGWSYDPVENRLIVRGNLVAEDDELAVSFWTWKNQE